MRICVLTEGQADYAHYMRPASLRDHAHHRHCSLAKAEYLIATGRARWYDNGHILEVFAGRTVKLRPRESTQVLTEFGTGCVVLQRV